MFSTYLSLNRKKNVSKVFNIEGRFFAWNCIFLIENTSDREENCAINESKSAPVYSQHKRQEYCFKPHFVI